MTWISVEDDLPPLNKKVQLRHVDFKEILKGELFEHRDPYLCPHRFKLAWVFDTKPWCDQTIKDGQLPLPSFTFHEDKCVTHWMPLTKASK